MSAWRVGADAAMRTPAVSQRGGANQAGRVPAGRAAAARGSRKPLEPAGVASPAGAGETPDEHLDAGGSGKGPEPQTWVDKITKWIPGDALALYVAAVTAFGAKTGAQPSWLLLICGVVLTGVLVPLSAFANKGGISSATVLPAILAAIAFAIWSLTVPFSGWQRWSLVHENQAAVAIVAAVIALLFGLLAEGLTKRAAAKAGD
jgi:hypothetical protein